MASGDDVTLRLSVDGHESIAYSVFKVVGEEEISCLFEFVIDFTAPVPFQDLPTFVHRSATLEIARAGHARTIAGMVSEIREFGASPDRRFILRLTLLPRLYRLSLSRQNQVFATERAMTVPEVIEAELTANALTGLAVQGIAGRLDTSDYRMLLDDGYPEREYMVQLNETDLDFICRWAERDGIFFFFRVENGKDVVIFGDRRVVFDDEGVTLPSRSVSGLLDRQESAVLHFNSTVKALPKKIILRDHNYRLPSVPLTVEAEVDPEGHGTVVEHGGYFSTDKEGRRLAQIRAEEMLCRRRLFSGTSNFVGMMAGGHFTLQDHFPTVVDGAYLVTKVCHEITRTTSEIANHADAPFETAYSNSFECIPNSAEYRPERRTPWPKMPGLTKARIDGESDGRRAELDHEGRYRIRRNADMRYVADGQASLPVRKAEPFGGDQIGMHMPLLKGTEIVLSHVNGDPDRPMIIGAIPNTLHPSQVTGKASHKNRIKTPSGVTMEIDDGYSLRSDANPGRDGDGAFRFIVPGQDDDRDVRTYMRLGKADSDQDVKYFDKTQFEDAVPDHWPDDFSDLITDGATFATNGYQTNLVGRSMVEVIKGAKFQYVEKGVSVFSNGPYSVTLGSTDTLPSSPLPPLPTMDIGSNISKLISHHASFADPITGLPTNVRIGTGVVVDLALGNKVLMTAGAKQTVTLAATTDVSMALKSSYDMSVSQAVSVSGSMKTSLGLNADMAASVDYKWKGSLGVEVTNASTKTIHDSQWTKEVYPIVTSLAINTFTGIIGTIILLLGGAAGALGLGTMAAGVAYSALANKSLVTKERPFVTTNPLNAAGAAALGGSTVINALVTVLQLCAAIAGVIYVIAINRKAGKPSDPEDEAANQSMDSTEKSASGASGTTNAGSSTVLIEACKVFAKRAADLARSSVRPKISLVADPKNPEDVGVLLGFDGTNYIHITPTGINIVATSIDIQSPFTNHFGMLTNVGNMDVWGRASTGHVQTNSLISGVVSSPNGQFTGFSGKQISEVALVPPPVPNFPPPVPKPRRTEPK